MLETLAVRGSVVLLAGMAAPLVMRRSSAAVRHLIWACVFACLHGRRPSGSAL